MRAGLKAQARRGPARGPTPPRSVYEFRKPPNQLLDRMAVVSLPPGFAVKGAECCAPVYSGKFTDSSTYAIKLAAPDGLVTRILTRPFEPSPVTDGVKAAEKERRLEELGDGGGDPFREAMIE